MSINQHDILQMFNTYFVQDLLCYAVLHVHQIWNNIVLQPVWDHCRAGIAQHVTGL